MSQSDDPRTQLRRLRLRALAGALILPPVIVVPFMLLIEARDRAEANREKARVALHEDQIQITSELNAAFASALPPDPAAVDRFPLDPNGVERTPPRRRLGKVVILQLGTDSTPDPDRLDKLHFELPDELQARTAAEVSTICWIKRGGPKWSNVDTQHSLAYTLTDRNTGAILGTGLADWFVPIGSSPADAIDVNDLNNQLMRLDQRAKD